VYSGYKYETLLKLSQTDLNIKMILHNINVLVDGKYNEKLAESNLKYRGSSNQRIINVPESLKLGKTQLLLFA
jgi:anaerobic ribonucleoside-triphosphate reductase activating protein